MSDTNEKEFQKAFSGKIPSTDPRWSPGQRKVKEQDERASGEFGGKTAGEAASARKTQQTLNSVKGQKAPTMQQDATATKRRKK